MVRATWSSRNRKTTGGVVPARWCLPATPPISRNIETLTVDVRHHARHQVGEVTPRPARHRPTQRAVTGIEKKVPVLRAADHGRAIRRCRPQARPEFTLLHITALRVQTGDDLLQHHAASR